jgi:hypothetical protein
MAKPPRKPTRSTVETKVLVDSRRRCCICFGLSRDVYQKLGQIAHLDQNRANDKLSNLAFLCFEHHAEYDARYSQAKGLTISEVKTYRTELHQALGSALSQTVRFGKIEIPAADPYAGQYIRIGDSDDSAEVTLTPIPGPSDRGPRYYVTGEALWGAGRQYGPNIGVMDFLGIMEEDRVIENPEWSNEETAGKTIISFVDDNKMVIEEENVIGIYGMNVSFVGEYERVR